MFKRLIKKFVDDGKEVVSNEVENDIIKYVPYVIAGIGALVFLNGITKTKPEIEVVRQITINYNYYGGK